jgi:K+-sensing histidine kinase KdpD
VSPLENAVKYADSTVQVSVTSTPAGCRVVISDDGPGIPAAELDSLAAGTETDLQHGRGLGLWQLKWGVDALNGDLAFETDNGTTVRIELPALGDNSDERNADADSDAGTDDSGPATTVDDNSTDGSNDSKNDDDTDSEA